EAFFADRFQLIAVHHPQGVEVYPNEGMTDPPRPFKLYVTRGARPPLTAVDDHGNDVLPRIRSMDRQYPDDFTRDPIRGYATEHTLTMNLANTETVAGTAGVPPAAGNAVNSHLVDLVAAGGGRGANDPSKKGHASHKD